MGANAATTLFLVRHAAHDRVDRVLCGRMAGVSLGSVGLAQASGLAQRLTRERVAAVFSSPLERARETAGPIAEALGHETEIAHGINEIDFGEWTGAAFDALSKDERWHVWNRNRAAATAPGGETMAAVQARALGQVETWRRAFAARALVAVSHGDVIKSVVCGLLGLSLDRVHTFEIGPASITTAVLWEGGGKIVSLNEHIEVRS